MRVQTFQGRTLEEILPQVREALGPDAVVLSQRPLVSGGVGGFFGKRMLEVTAADRMPTDEQLIELEDEFTGNGEGPAQQREQAAPTLDLVDDWDPSNDDELAEEYGSVLQRAVREATQRPSTPLAPAPDAVPAAAAPPTPATPPMPAATSGGGDRRLQTTPYASAPTATPRPAAETGYQPLELPAVTPGMRGSVALAAAEPAIDPTEQFLAQADARVAELDQSPEHEARRLAARAQQAIAAATREIEQQLGQPRTPASLGGTLRAQVHPVADRGSRLAPPATQSRTQATGLPVEVVEEARRIEDLLLASGADRDVAQAVIERVVRHRRPFSSELDLRSLTREVIAETIRTETGWAPVGRTHRMALVGPSGAGKSTVAAKVAEGYARMGGYNVAVISVVPPEAAAAGARGVDPLLQHAGIDVRVVTSPEQMIVVLERLVDHDLVVIDTPSAAYLDAAAFNSVAACLAAVRVDEVHAVVPLATSIREAESVIEHFRPLGASRLTVTKLDESRYAGQLLNFGFRFGLPITFLSDGPRVPEDLRAASAPEIASLIVPHHE